MKTIVIYDSTYGNTKQIAQVIAGEIKDAKTIHVSDAKTDEVKTFDIIIVGCPINGWQPTEKTREFLNSFSAKDLSGKYITAFDTRVKLFIHGDARKKIAKALNNAGAKNIAESNYFVVSSNRNAPVLLDGELDRAKKWAQEIDRSIGKRN